MSPAYDLVASALVVEGDDEELALTLNGKKKKIKRVDFETALNQFQLEEKAIENIFSRFKEALPKWKVLIPKSFLLKEMQTLYLEMIEKKIQVLDLDPNQLHLSVLK